ncbi:methylenetetrahydrofolate--tRNA-(uracil(54)-C(5))-methyltransferase (FADH(2)-oxidizing) TrmFO [Hyphococcus flavus]|uniref:Methylenetetrahydrofolate--tRNA-(uracil-5-)-methyltransferase TrmFO n=1 Tax=Hyphococcus flavus TaxID=1866326 RepID=A0AAE9ZJ62_9PROT|nr:methylenetetrahydrofolate--tRNA-(uracil(54)-C(5))-methyltransferase (FADH(2)-oxidizing) TrmFO [Hyphococcus flavus]WDI31425.1 methylenetetrahydrofolate--tRNA-(uracil(54)-C(5))-methyltransferase (FADH(2)-oxidizing) TrmFO [Hyphococcus flavus]
MTEKTIHIIGAGLAGSEAAWQAANSGAHVTLHEMRPVHQTEAHHTDGFAELVCSNSFRSDDAENNAVGLLHEEMRRAGSLVLRAADNNKVPAGGALAVDRDAFSAAVTDAINNHPNIDVEREQIDALPPEEWDNVIIATGPLTAAPLAEAIRSFTGEESLAFFDAIAPIIYKETINFDIAWYQSRYDKVGPDGDGADYINCPMDEDQYAQFLNALLTSEKTEFKDWEKSTPYFEGCLPIEVMAERGPETLRFGPMKPVGLTDPRTGKRPHAVVQLRQDNAIGTLYNMVGFQTKLKYGAQTDVFRLIPGLEKAEFARLGGIHRNTFLNSPKLLDENLRLKKASRLRFAGQITGVEGYLESAAIGLLAGRFAVADTKNEMAALPPPTTALGALLNHITGGHISDSGGKTFQPMNINFGLFPDLEAPRKDADGNRLRGKERGRARKRLITQRALLDLAGWLDSKHLAAE